MRLSTLIDKQWRVLTRDASKPLVTSTGDARTTGRFVSVDGNSLVRLVQPKGTSKIMVISSRSDGQRLENSFESAYCGNNDEQVARCVLENI